MQTQVNCPQCGVPFTTEIHQIIDAGQNPQLKQQLLSGQLNIARCPQCGAGGALTTPLLFHDPAYEMFIIHVPQEMHLPHDERERMIGRLTQQAMNAIPQEQRRAYLFQPQMMLTMQSFMEKVLETEGVTKEMIERQKKQAELLQKLAGADADVVDYLLKDRMGEIDDVFFAMLQQFIDSAAQMSDPQQLIKLTNLRAKLMTDTPIGRKVEKQQIAVHKLNVDAKKAEGLSPELLLTHVLKNQDDDEVIDGLVRAGQGALTYQFFQLLTAEIEKEEQAKNLPVAAKLTNVRTRLLTIFDAMQAETQQVLAQADQLVQEILDAEDKEALILQSLNKIDDAFMYALSNRVARADQQGNAEESATLRGVYEIIRTQMESQYPPEILMLNGLMEAETDAQQDEILEANKALLSPELLDVIERLITDVNNSGQEEAAAKLAMLKEKIAGRL